MSRTPVGRRRYVPVVLFGLIAVLGLTGVAQVWGSIERPVPIEDADPVVGTQPPEEPVRVLEPGQVLPARARGRDSDGRVYGPFHAQEGGDYVLVDQQVEGGPKGERTTFEPAALELLVDGRSVAALRAEDGRSSSVGGPVVMTTWFPRNAVGEAEVAGASVELRVTTPAGTVYTVDGLDVGEESRGVVRSR
ncbi:hypothetical protein [Puerhibacterium puerhi]|uniref:hypothetical protein n=1 Tax=Puerhibacterium puerhi TaxID=2692623 RepID=UPI001359A327|nr:hypothetical protein [Puerhibacterium puerhi]